MKRYLPRIFALAIMIVGGLLAVVPTTDAQESSAVIGSANDRFPPRDPFGPYPSEAPLTPALDGGGITIQATSPSGCGGKTDYAHPSGSEASVHGRTICKFAAVGELGVTTTLQKKGWLWWDNLATDSSHRFNSKDSEDAHPHWNCTGSGTQSYRGFSSHYSIEATGTYTGNTAGAEGRFSC